MNRFEYSEFRLSDFESPVETLQNVTLYDGGEKSTFRDGDLALTTHRLFWATGNSLTAPNRAGQSNVLCLRLQHIAGVEQETSTSLFSGTRMKLVLQLRPLRSTDVLQPGPVLQSTATHVKLSLGSNAAFVDRVRNVLAARVWEADQPAAQQPQQTNPAPLPVVRPLRSGIVGIERTIHERHKETNETISTAFQDLNALMALAKDMVAVSQAISAKVVQRQGEISADETVRFKAHLLGLGIDNPVLRDSVRDQSTFHALLSQEIESLLLDPLLAAGGMMPLAEAYCRVNRARGLELLSPEDVLQACRLFRGAVKLRTFDASGTMVLQLDSHDDAVVAAEISAILRAVGSVSFDELAHRQQIPVMLAQTRLLAAEQLAVVCRDESIGGLRFYANRFLCEGVAEE